jgi:stage IV sporulation protein FB
MLYLWDFLSYNSYLYSLEVNKLVFFFNLLPIWPLDGAKILFYILSFFITLKRCYYFVISLSVISTVTLVFLTINDPQLVIITFLVLSQLEFIITYSIDYYKTLAFRIIKTPNYRIKIHSKNDIYLPYENVHFNDIIFVDERYLINDILNRKKV